MSADSERAIRWANGTANGPGQVREVSAEDLCMDTLLMVLSQSGLDRIDEAISDYYASRVPDPHEALWRTDYTRAHMRHDLAEDRPWREHPDAIWLRERANEIEQRWTADPAVAPRWAELHALWIETGNPYSSFPHSSPEQGLPTMPGEAPPGMDPVTWRSQLQARDLAGHARWLNTTTTTTDREGAEPMKDITRGETSDQTHETESQSRYPDLPPRYDDPSLVPMTPAEAHWIFTGQGYTSEYATHMVTELAGANIELTGDNVRSWMRRPENQHALQEQARYRYRPESARPQAPAERVENSENPREIESETEQQMRADFMRAESCVARSPEDYDPADEVDYAEYASPWLNGDERWMHEWVYLSDATQRWRDNPAAAETSLVQRVGVLSAIEARSEDQARYIAEHGIERDDHGLLTSRYVTRVEDQEWDISEADQESLARAFFASEPDERRQHVRPHMPWANAAEVSTAAPFPVSADFARARTAALSRMSAPIPGTASASSPEREGMER
ncbi:hypothetical protein [Nocardia sp. CA-120079]|uniref:hypothetical protein n=1 Tax=Nocardia sp. CA-120079 TaxID=3239974 RepID=UPI003D95AC84